jgi:hypothetical protein
MEETTFDGKTVASGTVTPFVWKASGVLKTGVDGAKISSSGSKPPSSGGMQAPGQMASINITSLKLPPVASPDLMGPGIQAVTCGTPSAPETVSEYEPTTWDMLYNLGENMRYSGDYLGGFASDATYNMVNDAYTGYNLVVNKRYTDLRGVQVGYTKAVRCATFNWASILSLPLGWMGEGAQEGSNIALGVREHLDDFAKSVNGSTWKSWGSSDFEAGFLNSINNPSNKIHFNLTGIDNPWRAISQGAKGYKLGGYTNWELYQIYSNPAVIERTIFYQNGNIIANPFK